MPFSEVKELLSHILEPLDAEAGLKTPDSNMPGKDDLRAMVRETMERGASDKTAIVFKNDAAKEVLEMSLCGAPSSLLNDPCSASERATVNERLKQLEELQLSNRSSITNNKDYIYLGDNNTFAANSADLAPTQGNVESIAQINSRFIAYREGTRTTAENSAVMPALGQAHADMRAYIELSEDAQKGEISRSDLKDFLKSRIENADKAINEITGDNKNAALMGLYHDMQKHVASFALASLENPSSELDKVSRMSSEQQAERAVTLTGKVISQLGKD